MPQRKELSWGQLRVGLMVAAALIIVVAGIFLVSGQTGFFGSQYTLTSYFASAQGLRTGAEVDLAGVPVGSVSSVHISSSQDPNRAVTVVMRIQKKFKKDIRSDSIATVETAGLLGASFVDISRGSPAQPLLSAGDSVKGAQGSDMKAVVNNANDVLSNLTQLSKQLNGVANQITTGKGTIGQFIYSAALANEMHDTVTKMDAMITGISKGRGSVGQLVASDAIANKLNSTLDRANGLMDQIQNGKGTIAKLINDPAVANNLNDDLVQVKTLLSGINQGQGTIGKAVKDPQLYNRLNQMAGNVDTITSRMAKGQGSLGLLSTNTKFYDNLTQSSEALREFLDEFRKNPKKYLTVHVRIF